MNKLEVEKRLSIQIGVNGWLAAVILAIVALIVCAALASAADVQITNNAATNITTTSAYFNGTVVATNATNPTLTLYYGTSDGDTNAGSWMYTNSYGVASTGAVSTNITGLTPAQLYYYRWYALDTLSNQFDWADSTTNFWTLAGVPTGAPPAHTYIPVMVGINGVLVSPTNFFPTNSVLSTNGFARDGSRTMLAHFLFAPGLGGFAYFGTATSDGADNAAVYYGAGGARGTSRGAYTEYHGNETPSHGAIVHRVGDAVTDSDSDPAVVWYLPGATIALYGSGLLNMGGGRMTNCTYYGDLIGTFGGNNTNYYRNFANITNVTYIETLTVQDPTNGVPYYLPNPWAQDVTLTEIFVQAHGATGNVDIIRRHRTNTWYSYTTIDSNTVADADGTVDTSFSSTWWSNNYKIGFIVSDLSAFATTNLISVDFKVTKP